MESNISSINNSIIALNDINNETYRYVINENISKDLIVNISNSHVNIIFEFVNEIEEINYQINIDENSSVKVFNIINDTNKNLKLNKIINNKGEYLSLQIDLTLNSVSSLENINCIYENSTSNVIDGIYAQKNAKKNYQTNFNHVVGNAKSNAKIFAINSEVASVNIHTDAFIKNGATQTKTSQEGRIINLSNTCSSIVFPDLHIDENDVEASHSCSVGSVNLEHLYYLETRGLSEKEAKNVLIKGYFNPITNNITNEEIKKNIDEVINKRIGIC